MLGALSRREPLLVVGAIGCNRRLVSLVERGASRQVGFQWVHVGWHITDSLEGDGNPDRRKKRSEMQSRGADDGVVYGRDEVVDQTLVLE